LKFIFTFIEIFNQNNMKKTIIAFSGILLLASACSSSSTEESTSDDVVDLDNLSFCDCMNNRFDIKGEIAREKDAEAKKDLEAELALFDDKCKKYDLKEGATEQERIDYQLDWNKKAAECR
jgi:hypothetical protein